MKYRYWYTLCRGGNITKRRLLSLFGSAKAIFKAPEEVLRETGIFSASALSSFAAHRSKAALDKDYEAFRGSGVSLVTLEDGDYPELLKHIADAPYGLFYRGSLPGEEEHCVAMVGARRPSGYGELKGYELAAALSGAGYSIVSGMALGIDSIAHRAALDSGGRTYAFLGCGADVCYPKRHRKLYEDIIANGAVFSEYAPGAPPVAEHFPARNRLISGMADQTIVIEARAKSGSLITADFALEQGRDVYALPGRITDPLSEGTNRLIAQGAAMICSKESLLSDFLELPGAGAAADFCSEEKMLLEKEDLLVYSCFDFYAKSLARVQEECDLDLSDLISAVTRLCRYGLIRENVKNYYVRIR